MTHLNLPIDYEMLRLIWWALLGILLIGFAALDGFDLGAAALLPFVAKDDTEKRIVINSVGPMWEGNQVWFILGGGASFAAWPLIYSASFSGFYFAMFLVLVALIIRPVGFDFRNKVENTKWKNTWDICLTLGGIVPSLVFGVAFGNLLLGVPFHFDQYLRVFYTGSFFALLNPFALVCGLVSLFMIMLQGALFISLKTEEEISNRARCISSYLVPALIVLVSIAALWTNFIDGYLITSKIDPHGPSNPLLKEVIKEKGAWFHQYKHYPILMILPILLYVSLAATYVFNKMKRFGLAFITNSITIFSIIANVGCVLFPFLMTSSSNPSQSLTVYDASSSHLSLFIMLIAVIIFLPIIGSYTIWGYRVMRGKVTRAFIEENNRTLY